MRIIAGDFKGRRLRTVPGGATRSTADRVKESLFNILLSEVPNAVVLDLYCGAGTLGLEALSRGAERVIFVDRSRRALKCTQANVALVGAETQVEVLCQDALAALRLLAGRGESLSLILADPPYGEGLPAKVLAAVGASACRAPVGVLVIEHHKKDLPLAQPGDAPTGFSLWTARRFGDTVLTIWRWVAAS
jgi:16S rRNA (guanine(966)-N(2))-methyltransferase RsmD